MNRNRCVSASNAIWRLWQFTRKRNFAVIAVKINMMFTKTEGRKNKYILYTIKNNQENEKIYEKI